jgi:hypothetical protein
MQASAEMTQPFEFKNPLDGAPRPLSDGSGKNPFADENGSVADVANDNIFATSGSASPDVRPEYVTMLTHRGPLQLSLGIANLLICVASGVIAIWEPAVTAILVANWVLAIALSIKAVRDLRAMRAGAMDHQGRSATRAAGVLALITIALTIPAVVLNILVRT